MKHLKRMTGEREPKVYTPTGRRDLARLWTDKIFSAPTDVLY